MEQFFWHMKSSGQSKHMNSTMCWVPIILTAGESKMSEEESLSPSLIEVSTALECDFPKYALYSSIFKGTVE